MHFQWVTATVAFFGAVTAIPCSEIGWSSGNLDEAPYSDPFDPQGRWEVVKANDCWVRFQAYEVGGNPMNHRVTKTEFTATPDEVSHTVNNFYGSPGNIMLWLPLMTTSFQYANILPGKINDAHEVVVGQPSIVKARTVISIILPSGKRKLTIVPVRPAEQGESDINIKRARDIGITGLAGTILQTDWAYSTAAEAQLVMFSIYTEQSNAYLERRRPDLKNAWITAEKADSNECVVIDFREFVDFVIDIRGRV